ncbi:MAG TPA: VOC family protein [Patescibacteria group bacterium]|nr:VOC family protein [Patescibacteria group bacterium]
MQTKLNPYISFNGNAREALEFYKSAFGGDSKINTFEEFHASEDPSENDKVMHGVLEAGSLTLMVADTPNRMEYKPGANVSMSLSGENEAELRGYYDKLSAGGQVTMPLEKAAWGDTFGMFTDKFGINWMVNISAGQKA